MDIDFAIEEIDQAGILLVFPIANKKEPASLWSKFYPRSKMRWEWDDDGDSRVADLWHLRTELSECSDVVYAKWYTGRATMFSREMFTAALAALATPQALGAPLGEEAARVYEQLEEDSPQSPRMLREATNLVGKFYASTFDRALKQLWMRLLVVGFGEIDDGAFPSLAVGASKLLFEDLWNDAKEMSVEEGQNKLRDKVGEDNPFYKYLLRCQKKLLVSQHTANLAQPTDPLFQSNRLFPR